jgi:hypothetical protein
MQSREGEERLTSLGSDSGNSVREVRGLQGDASARQFLFDPHIVPTTSLPCSFDHTPVSAPLLILISKNMRFNLSTHRFPCVPFT